MVSSTGNDAVQIVQHAGLLNGFLIEGDADAHRKQATIY